MRYLFISNLASPDAVEYPDTRQLSVMAFTTSQFGRPLWDMRTVDGRFDFCPAEEKSKGSFQRGEGRKTERTNPRPKVTCESLS